MAEQNAALKAALNVERQRLENQWHGTEPWRLWGPYLSERAWGTVREDYSADGDAWNYVTFDCSRSRAYRWNEDGMAGLCDEAQNLCLALALWNGRDPFLKERTFGLSSQQGNHGEDVKEVFFYVDATPSHSYLHYLYKYPQAEFPYQRLIDENARRDRTVPAFNLTDAGVFDDGRYFDVEVIYAKASPTQIHARIIVHNHGPEDASIQVLPTLWFRNTWSWGDNAPVPVIAVEDAAPEGTWAVRAQHPDLGTYRLYGRQRAELLFTDNETNLQQLYGQPNATPWVKDAFHRCVVDGDRNAVNPAQQGTKFAAWHALSIPAGQSSEIDLVLSADALEAPFARTSVVLASRQSESTDFYHDLLPDAGAQDHRILRRALAGMIWTKQFFHYDVERWLAGDIVTPPESRLTGRNSQWKHMKAADVISMPDTWEYPWFAAWDLAFHCASLALVDVDFAKDQIELMLSERYLHPNGQIPAYEWNFGDVNPPVHAWGALKCFRAERVQRGKADRGFLERVFHKLLLNYAWWINRKDSDGHNVFEGGFLGLDNISVFDRSKPLPAGYELKQADATGWMAMFALNMTVMALELAVDDPNYEDIAIQAHQQFLAIAFAIAGHTPDGTPLWDPDDGFFKDLIVEPDGKSTRINVFSMVGLIPLFATEVLDERLLAGVPRFRQQLQQGRGGRFRGQKVSACPELVNGRGEHLLSIVDQTMLPRILERLLDEEQFLSPYGVRSVSRIHATHKDLGCLPGVGEAIIEYVPGESNSPMFGGNSNWRGPIWLPVNFALIQAIEKFHRFLGDDFKVAVPCKQGEELNMKEVATLIAERIVDMYRHDDTGRKPVFGDVAPFRTKPDWRDNLLFFEYFNAETGQGIGAAHQTGWTGLIGNLVMRRYRKDIPTFWQHKTATRDAGSG